MDGKEKEFVPNPNVCFDKKLRGGKDFKFKSGVRTVHLKTNSTMTLDEFWEKNHMSNHTWDVSSLGGKR